MSGAPRPSSRAGLAARLGFAALIVFATLSPWRFEFDVEMALRHLERAVHRSPGARDAVDGLRNLVLFGGWGAIWYVTAPGRRAWREIAAATLSGAALSVAVESLQLFSPVRTASILDVGSNTLGAFGGALLAAVAIAGLRTRRGERSFVGIPAYVFAGSYLVSASLEGFVPLFRQEMLPGARGGPGQRLHLALAWLQARPTFEFPWFEMLLFLPTGAFLVAALAERGASYRAAGSLAAAAGMVLAPGIQLARGLAGMPISPGGAAAHAAGIVLGAALAASGLPRLTVRLRGAARPAALLTAYAAVLALWSWRPLRLETELAVIVDQLSLERLIPLHSHAVRVDLFSVVNIAALFFLFLPVGALLAVWPLSSQRAWRGLLPALYLSLLLEGAQTFVAGRYFDITDVLVQAAGAAVGWVVVRRAGFRPYGALLSPRCGGAPLRRAGARRQTPQRR